MTLRSRADGSDLDRYERLVGAITDYAIYMLDAQGIVTSWNRGAERLKGYAADEIIGKHFSIFYTLEARAAGTPSKALERAAIDGHVETEGWRIRKDAARFWAHVAIDPIRDDAGQVIGFAKVTQDMGERRAAQRALEDAREAMFQSQKMYALGQLTSGIAHDFNNLLTVITGALEMLKDEADTAQAEHLDVAMGAAERGAALIKQLLAFARGEEVKLLAVDVVAVVKGLLNVIRRAVGPAIHVEDELQPGLPSALVEPSQLNTALLNLAINARDAMPSGGTLKISVSSAPDGMVALEVADTGMGMDATTLESAMRPFFTTKAAGKGTGLGLAMVHGMAERCGGSLTLRSQPGKGTVVSLKLPGVTADTPLA
jgi:PAS domain S-box-containing protein